MAFETWLAFVAASFAMLIIPGPTVMLVVGYALGEGRRAAFGTMTGVLLGDLVAISLCAVGLGALLAASATVFTLFKWVGAAYLVWLGVRLWRAPVNPQGVEQVAASGRSRRAIHGFVVTALNPKGLAFFVAFLPQFMTAEAPVLPQLAVLAPTFVLLGGLTNAAFILAAGGVRARLRSPAVLRAINRVGGSFLIGAGVLTAAMRRA
ncbi:MAG: LysE family translocator [Thalassobaculum sp.]|uniref:LysE family translocator n=1 Tax=Thalassobaculum sp. TaxID=2022740 RepID=UPI0032EEBD54